MKHLNTFNGFLNESTNNEPLTLANIKKMPKVGFSIGSESTQGTFDQKWFDQNIHEMIRMYFTEDEILTNFGLDKDVQAEYEKALEEEIYKPFENDVDGFLKKYAKLGKAYTESGDYYIQIDKDKHDSEAFVDEYIMNSEMVPAVVKNEYREWRKDYAGIELK